MSVEVAPARPMWRRPWFVVLWLLALLLAGVFVTGLLLPPEYEFEFTSELDAPPAAVWTALHDPKSHPVGGSQCRSVELLGAEPGALEWREDLGASRATYRLVDETAATHAVLTGKDDVVPITFSAKLEVSARGEGSAVHCRVEGRIDDGTWHVPLFRVLVRIGAAKKGLRDWVGTLEGEGD